MEKFIWRSLAVIVALVALVGIGIAISSLLDTFRYGSVMVGAAVIACLIALLLIWLAWWLWSRSNRDVNTAGSGKSYARLRGGQEMPQQIIVKTYKGNQAMATALYQKDATRMAADGYLPTSQSWAPGAYSAGTFILALLLCIVLVGAVILVYMLLVKPDGTLSVTYQYNASHAVTPVAEKTCPKCAEPVKAAALVCRFCGHSFVSEAKRTSTDRDNTAGENFDTQTGRRLR